MEQDSTSRQQVKVTILNQSFTLLTSGDPREMIDLANQVDETRKGKIFVGIMITRFHTITHY